MAAALAVRMLVPGVNLMRAALVNVVAVYSVHGRVVGVIDVIFTRNATCPQSGLWTCR